MRRRIRYQRFEKVVRGMCDFIDCSIKGNFIGLRRLGETGKLADKLQR